MDEKLKDDIERVVGFVNFVDDFRIGGCKDRCSLYDESKPHVIYRGNPRSRIVLVSKSHKKEDVEKKKPFSGREGNLLRKIMSSVGFNLDEDMLVLNSIFCSSDKTLKRKDVDKCWLNVERALKIVKPHIVIACGKDALCQLKAKKDLKIGHYEGKWTTREDGLSIFCMINPGFILHKEKHGDTKELKQKIYTYMKYFKKTYIEKTVG